MSNTNDPGKSESKSRRHRENHENDVRLRPLAKDGEKMMTALRSHKMVAVLSKNEIMYTFIFQNHYQCFIHKLDDEEGRHRAFEIDEKTTAMIKNLSGLADLMFEVTPKKDMNPMGVMVAAERGIIAFLDATGQLPAEDVNFMDWQDTPKNDTENTEGDVT